MSQSLAGATTRVRLLSVVIALWALVWASGCASTDTIGLDGSPKSQGHNVWPKVGWRGKLQASKGEILCVDHHFEVTNSGVRAACTIDQSEHMRAVAEQVAREKADELYRRAVLNQTTSPDMQVYVDYMCSQPQPEASELGEKLLQLNHLIVWCAFDASHKPEFPAGFQGLVLATTMSKHVEAPEGAADLNSSTTKFQQ